jgi:hypothetical protein
MPQPVLGERDEQPHRRARDLARVELEDRVDPAAAKNEQGGED